MAGISKNEFHIKKQSASLEEFIEPLSCFSLLQTQSLLFSVLNSTNTGVCLLDHSGKILFINEEYCRIHGFSRAELLGKNFILFVPKAFQKQALVNHQNFINIGTIQPATWQITKKDGTHIEISEKVQLLVQPDGQRLKMSTITDLTEKNKAEETIFRERNLLRTLIDIIPDYIFVKDRDSRHLINNKANIELIGAKTEEETLGKTISDFIDPMDSQKFLDDDRRIIESETGIFNHEETIFDKNGIQKTLLTTKIPLRDKSGSVIGLVGISRDISNRKKREQELKLMEAVITHTNDSVIITEANLLDAPGPRIMYVNKAFTKLTGYSSGEIIGKNPRFLQGPKSDFMALGLLGEALRNKRPYEVETINYKKDGEEFWVNISVSPLIDESGSLTHFIAIQRDITERKLSETALITKTTLLKGIAVVIETLMNFDDWETAVFNCLKIMGETVEADRAYFIKNYRDPLTHRLMASQELEWTNGEVSIQIDNPYYNAIALEEHPLFLEAIEHKKPFVSLTKDLVGATRKILEDQDIQSTLQVPIFIENEFYGYIGFDDCKKERIWNADEIFFLQSLTTNLAVAMERKDNLDTIKRTLEEKNTILESIGDSFFAVDRNWELTYMNKASRNLLQLENENILGKNLWEIYTDLKDSAFYDHYQRAMETMKPVHFDEYYVLMETWLEVSAYPSKNGLSVYFRDITHRKEYEASLQTLNTELLKSNKELSISNQELEQFAYVASHDLQEPLRMVSSFLTQIERKYGNVLDEKGRKYIHFAVDGAKRMRTIILDLLEFSRVGKPDDAKEPIDTDVLIEEILLFNRELISEKKAQILFSGLPEIYGFKTPIQQLFQNLITNAVKYQPEGQKPVITIEGKEHPTHWEFSVHDNGIGINAEYFDKIFIIFQRLHQKDEYSGSGMGLAICKKIVESHNGNIWVTSVEDNGSSFHFTLGKN